MATVQLIVENLWMAPKVLEDCWTTMKRILKTKGVENVRSRKGGQSLCRRHNMSPTCHFANLPFCQLAILPTCHFAKVASCCFIKMVRQLAVLQKFLYINLPFFQMALCQLTILPKSIMPSCCFAKMTLCQLAILPTCHFATLALCCFVKMVCQLAILQNGITPHCHFAKKYYANLPFCQKVLCQVAALPK